MLGPYRAPGPVEPDLPARCSAERCSAFVPYPPRFPASIGCAPPPRRALLGAFAKALSAAAIALLLAATASLSAVTYATVEQYAWARAARNRVPVQTSDDVSAPARPQAASLPPRAARARFDPGPAVTLSMMGDPTHDVDELWRRAVALEAAGADVLVSHRRLSGSHIPLYDAGAFRVVPEDHKGYSGLRLIDLSDGFAATAGVAAGDLVLAVNGYTVGTHAAVARAFATARDENAAVVEIWRDGRRFVLFIDLRPR